MYFVNWRRPKMFLQMEDNLEYQHKGNKIKYLNLEY
jgi:hypothetical protein